MTESQKTRFVDGLRVTPLHLNHSQATAAHDCLGSPTRAVYVAMAAA